MKLTVKVKWDQFRLWEIHIPRGQEAETCVCDICSARRTKGIGRKEYKAHLQRKSVESPQEINKLKLKRLEGNKRVPMQSISNRR